MVVEAMHIEARWIGGIAGWCFCTAVARCTDICVSSKTLNEQAMQHIMQHMVAATPACSVTTRARCVAHCVYLTSVQALKAAPCIAVPAVPAQQDHPQGLGGQDHRCRARSQPIQHRGAGVPYCWWIRWVGGCDATMLPWALARDLELKHSRLVYESSLAAHQPADC
jgi:hypothetical protein